MEVEWRTWEKSFAAIKPDNDRFNIHIRQVIHPSERIPHWQVEFLQNWSHIKYKNIKERKVTFLFFLGLALLWSTSIWTLVTCQRILLIPINSVGIEWDERTDRQPSRLEIVNGSFSDPSKWNSPTQSSSSKQSQSQLTPLFSPNGGLGGNT